MIHNGTIPSGWYESKVVEIETSGKHGIRSGARIKFLLPEVGQFLNYYIPPGKRGHFDRKNLTYYLGYTYHSKKLYELRLLINKFVRLEIESSKHLDGKSFVIVKRFAFSEYMFFPPVNNADEPCNGNGARGRK